MAAAFAAAASAGSSPTGRIAFASASGIGGNVQIWVMNGNGTGRDAVSPPTSSNEGLALSADGKRLAFVAHGDVYVMNANGSGVRRLTSSPASEGSPSWSPNGR